jgi:hypothetical protein
VIVTVIVNSIPWNNNGVKMSFFWGYSAKAWGKSPRLLNRPAIWWRKPVQNPTSGDIPAENSRTETSPQFCVIPSPSDKKTILDTDLLLCYTVNGNVIVNSRYLPPPVTCNQKILFSQLSKTNQNYPLLLDVKEIMSKGCKTAKRQAMVGSAEFARK